MLADDPVELLDALYRRADQVEPAINAWVARRTEQAYAAAREAEEKAREKTEALVDYAFPAWPYSGPIAIRETHPEHGWQHAHVFHRWRYLGSVKTERASSDPQLRARLVSHPLASTPSQSPNVGSHLKVQSLFTQLAVPLTAAHWCPHAPQLPALVVMSVSLSGR